MSNPAHLAILVASVAGIFAFSYFMVEIWEDKWQRKQHAPGQSTRRTGQSASWSGSQPPTTQDEANA